MADDNIVYGVDFKYSLAARKIDKMIEADPELEHGLMMDAALFGVSIKHTDEKGVVTRVPLDQVFIAPSDDCA